MAPPDEATPSRAVTTGPAHHFFGYYDKSPWDATGRYLVALETQFMDRLMEPDDVAVIGMADLEMGNWVPLAETRAWNWQQGCMLQWLPSAPDRLILYNDRVDDAYVSVIRDVQSGQVVRTLPRTAAAIGRDGSQAVCLNFARVQRHRPYGYVGLPDPGQDNLCPSDDGIWWMDLETGENRLIVSFADVASRDPKTSMAGASHWFNHLQFCTDDSRFVFLHRWMIGEGRWETRLYTANPDGSEVRLLADEALVSHFDWCDDHRILVWARLAGRGDHFYLIDDQTGEVETVGEGVLTKDGHCSYSPDRRWILTDEYPDAESKRPLILYRVGDGARIDIGRFYSPPEVTGPIRCDLHPRWNRDGTQVCFDSVHEGTRQVYVRDVAGIVHARSPLPKGEVKTSTTVRRHTLSRVPRAVPACPRAAAGYTACFYRVPGDGRVDAKSDDVAALAKHVEGRWSSLREVFAMAWPVVIRVASYTAMTFVDVVMVSRVGKVEVAAIVPAALTFFTIYVFIEGFASLNNTFVSQNFGARRFSECARYTWHAIYVVVALSAVVQVAHVFAPKLFALMGHASDVQVRELIYFRYRLYGAVVIGLVVTLSGFYQGISRPRVAMVVGLIANAANVGINYVLIFGKLGLPAMGIGGAALGTVIASLFQLAILFVLFLRNKTHKEFGTRSSLRLDLRRLGRCIRVGGPAGVHWMLDVGTWAVFVTVIVGRFGTDQLGASNIAGQFVRLSWLPTIGLNMAATQLMGQWIGRGRIDVAKRRAYTALKLGMIYMTTMGVVFLVFRYQLVSLFRPEPAVAIVAAKIMIVAAVFQIFDAIGIVLYGALKGAGDTLAPAIMMIASAWIVFLPSALLFSRVLGLEAPGAWIGAAIHLALLAGLMYWRFRSERWRRFKLIEPLEKVPSEATVLIPDMEG